MTQFPFWVVSTNMPLSDHGNDTGATTSRSSTTPTASLPRSKGGCTTCRRRKVKCDEVRPQCGHCSRLEKQCDWSRRYRFEEMNHHVHEKYSKAGLSSPDAREKSSKKWQEMIATRQLPNDRDYTLPEFSELSDQDTRERKALTREPGAYNLVVRPESFAELSDYEDSNQSMVVAHRLRRQDSAFATDPDVAELPVGELASMMDRRPKAAKRYTLAMLPSPQLMTISIDDGFREDDVAKHVHLFETEICNRILPFAVKYGLTQDSNNRNTIVAMSSTFRPLQHAICAVTLLSFALRGRPHLLTGAFSHYQRAISACAALGPAELYTSRFFYLHYLLLLHDATCTAQGWPHEAGVASQHLTRLFDIARNQPRTTWNPLQMSISWRLLLSDSLSCICGSEEAGAYVQAFQANRCPLPDFWKTPVMAPGCDDDTPQLCTLMYRVYEFIADFSQWRRAGTSASSSEMQFASARLLADLTRVWDENCPSRLRLCDDENSHALQPFSRTFFNIVRLEYAAVRLVLLTSMYTGQRVRPGYNREEVANLCSIILSISTEAVANGEVEAYRAHALFMVGYSSRIVEEQAQVMALFRVMEDSPVAFTARKGRQILERVHWEQTRRRMIGGVAEEVDWKDFAPRDGEGAFALFSI